MEVHECRGVREKAMLINVVLMQYISTGKVQGGDEASRKSFPSFISWFYLGVKYGILWYCVSKTGLMQRCGGREE